MDVSRGHSLSLNPYMNWDEQSFGLSPAKQKGNLSHQGYTLGHLELDEINVICV